jgi:hypothetical protein
MFSFSVTKLEDYLVSSGAHGHCLRYPRYFGKTISRPSKNISDPNLVIYLFPTAPIKLKLGLQIDGRLKIATYLTNQTI